MQFLSPLLRGTLLRRYKRFFADVELADGSVVTAHTANTGGMTGVAEPGMEVWLSRSDNPKRRLAWSWELTRVGDQLVGIHTGNPNRILPEALAAGMVPELAGYDSIRREVRYGTNSRVDLLLEAAERPPCYVEIKNVHLQRGNRALFPDAVTARGAKHLAELALIAGTGARAVMAYVVQRSDCDSFAIAEDIDPGYAEGLRQARAAGVEAICYACRVTTDAVVLDRPLPLQL